MTPLGKLGPRALSGNIITLEPLTEAHREDLEAAACDPSIWRFLPLDGAKEFAKVWDMAMADMAAGTRLAFAVRRMADNAVIGSTSYLADVPVHGRVEIGWTWYVREAQGGVTNPEAKLLLMANAFERCGYHRVELKTDSTNLRSRAAIKRLGAEEEGILRGHMWVPLKTAAPIGAQLDPETDNHGYWRDTVYFSVLAEDWPGVKARLEARVAAG